MFININVCIFWWNLCCKYPLGAKSVSCRATYPPSCNCKRRHWKATMIVNGNWTDSYCGIAILLENIVVLWYCNIVVLLYCNIVVLWYCGIVVLQYCGIVVLQYCGIVVLWYCNIVVLWYCNIVGNYCGITQKRVNSQQKKSL